MLSLPMRKKNSHARDAYLNIEKGAAVSSFDFSVEKTAVEGATRLSSRIDVPDFRCHNQNTMGRGDLIYFINKRDAVSFRFGSG